LIFKKKKKIVQRIDFSKKEKKHAKDLFILSIGASLVSSLSLNREQDETRPRVSSFENVKKVLT
jgi:hypothetical protein